MCICLFVCLFVCCHLSSGAAKACLWTLRNPAGPHSCVFVFVCLFVVLFLLFGCFCFLFFVCYLVVCCHLLSGVACLWTWRNPGPHSCVNQSESEATFSVEKSATASIIRHLPPSLQIVLDFVYRNLTLLKIRCYWKWTKRENSSLLSSDTLSSPPPPGSLLIGSDFDSSFQMDQFVPAQHWIATEEVVKSAILSRLQFFDKYCNIVTIAKALRHPCSALPAFYGVSC